jgi:hypothetical protein
MKKRRTKRPDSRRERSWEPAFTLPSVSALAGAVERLDLDAGWPTIRPSVLPLLPRHTPPAIRAGAPIQAILGPGLVVGFGIDLGPAFAAVTRDMVARWEIDDAEVVAAAVGNVRALAAELPPGIVKDVALPGAGTVRILQTGGGWASALLVVPEALPRFVGPGPHHVGAPSRDVLLAFPAATPVEIAFDLVEGIAALDPAGLVPACYRHASGSVEPLVAELGERLPAIDAVEGDRPRYVS